MPGKIKRACEAAAGWIALDGLLHFETSALIMMTLRHVVPIPVWANATITAAICIGKEIYDRIKKQQTIKCAIHDIIMDATGIAYALLLP